MELQDEPLIIDVRDVALADLKARIADAEQGVWRNSGSESTLSRPPKLRDAQEQAEIEERRLSLAKDLSDRVAEVSKNGPRDASPADRLAWRLMQLIGPNELASIDTDWRATYSESPTAKQRPWPSSIESSLSDYVTDTNASLPVGQRLDRSAVRHILGSVHQNPFEGYVLRVFLFDASGARIDRGESILIPSGVKQLYLPTGAALQVQDELGTHPIELETRTMQFMKSITDASARRPTSLNPELRQTAIHAEKHDPLSLFVADMLRSYAKLVHRNLVASLPDSTVFGALQLARGQLTVARFRTWLASYCVTDESNPGWLVVRPLSPTSTRSLRTSRTSLESFFEGSHPSSNRTLGEVGAFVNSVPRSYWQTISPIYVGLLSPIVANMFDQTSIDGLRVWARLTRAQQATLENGKPLAVQDLSAEARQELTNWVLNTEENGLEQDAGPGHAGDSTDVFPNGLVQTGVLASQCAAEQVVRPVYDNGTTDGPRILTSRELGRILAAQQLAKTQGKNQISGYRMGTKREIAVTFVTPQFKTTAVLREFDFDPNQIPMAFADLPDDFRKSVELLRMETLKERSTSPPTVIPPHSPS